MKQVLFCLIATMISIIACAQTDNKKKEQNFDFEQHQNGFPANWDYFGNADYLIYIDSIHAKSNRFSAVIEYKEGADLDFKALAFTLPNNYDGKQITLSGYIKTEDVTDGYAGLWMKIDPEIAFDYMHSRGITGTTDWQKYELTLTLNPSKTKQIVIGGLLVGKGKMWLDDLRVTVDGKTIQEAKTFVRTILPAEKDQEFDEASNITFPALTEQLTDNLELLGKLWGFLKYHHPEIGKGNYNHDYELFRMLPAYLKVSNVAQRDKVLLDWIRKYGNIPACENCKKTAEDVFLKPDFSWLKNSQPDLGADLKNKIEEIYANRHQGEHYYIELFPGVGNPNFVNESAYANMPYPDEGFRLLSLYRYWNMIQYFYPNRQLTNKNWNDVLKKYIPQFIAAKDELEYELAALQIIGEVNDTHANLWGGGDKISALRGEKFAPFRVQFIENSLVVTDYYNPELSDEVGLQPGDIITHINGRTTEQIVDSLKPYYPASNKASMLRDISGDILRSDKETIGISYTSSNTTHQKNLTLYNRDQLNMYHWYKVNPAEKSYKLLENNIGYITLASVKEEDISAIKENLKDTKGIIIDIRNYPSTFVPFSLGSYFVSTKTPFVKFTIGNINNPGEFTFTPPIEIPAGNETYKQKLVVLVNEISQSQAEYTAMAFRAGQNTTIIGSTTAGADGNVSSIVLPGGLHTMISGIGVFFPDGTDTQRVGIVPDITVKPTINGIKEGKDELLEKAIQVILSDS